MKAVDYSLRTGTGLQETTAAPLKALPREPSFLRRKVTTLTYLPVKFAMTKMNSLTSNGLAR
jgi:hypothetical protein